MVLVYELQRKLRSAVIDPPRHIPVHRSLGSRGREGSSRRLLVFAIRILLTFEEMNRQTARTGD
jgi:hypothetical protein